jgi:hypothetical protein
LGKIKWCKTISKYNLVVFVDKRIVQ